MDLRVRALEVEDISVCCGMVEDHTEYETMVLRELPGLWRGLLLQERMTAAVLEDHTINDRPRICGYGTGLFVSDTFVAEAKEQTFSTVRCHTARRLIEGKKIVLEHKEIAIANASGGLNLLLWQFVAPSRSDNAVQELYRKVAVDKLVEAAFRMFQGYQLREILIEVTGEHWMQFLVGSGLRVRKVSNKSKRDPASSDPLESDPLYYLLGLTREEVALGTRVSPAFTFQYPLLGLAYGEQKLLLLALDGHHDEAMAELLHLSPFTIKARWKNIYERVKDRYPELLPQTTEGKEAGRGVEKRRSLLNYLRGHMEELRPFRIVGHG